MDHERARERLNDYLEGDLSGAERRELEAHLETCDACRGELDALRRTLDGLGQLRRTDAPDAFAGRVKATIHRRSRGRFFGERPFWWRVPVEWLSLLLLVLLLLVLYLATAARPSRDQHPATAPPATAPPAPDRPASR